MGRAGFRGGPAWRKRICMGESNALGHMGLLFGFLGVVLMLGVGFAGALIAWAVGLGFVIGERFESSRGH